jgi:hypothetical protein
VKAPVGTVQRMTEWVMDDPSIDRLAEACDVIGAWNRGDDDDGGGGGGRFGLVGGVWTPIVRSDRFRSSLAGRLGKLKWNFRTNRWTASIHHADQLFLPPPPPPHLSPKQTHHHTNQPQINPRTPNYHSQRPTNQTTGVNVYPYFSAENEDLPTQWAKMLRRHPQHAHKIRLTETGWPSDGVCVCVYL